MASNTLTIACLASKAKHLIKLWGETAEADCELQTMVDQINRRTHILLGSVSAGMSNKMKQVEDNWNGERMCTHGL